MDRKALFTAHLRALNDSFAEWVQEQHASKVGELWVDGAEDYVRHTKRLLRDFDDVLQPAVAAAAPAAANGAAASVLPSVNGSAAPVNAGAAATAAAAASAPAPAGGAFGLPPASGGLGSILGLPAPGAAPAAPAPFAGFSFAPAASAPAPGGGAFGAPPAGGFAGFGGCGAAPAPLAAPSLPGAGGGGGGGGGGGEGAEEEEGPKEFVPEVKVDDGGSAFLFRGRAKVYVQGADKAWKEKGQGLLTVRQPAGGGPSAVVFTTEAGRVLVNAALYKGVKVVLQAKKPHMATLSLLVAAAETEEASMRPLLANLYAADSASEFAAAVSKAAPQ